VRTDEAEPAASGRPGDTRIERGREHCDRTAGRLAHRVDARGIGADLAKERGRRRGDTEFTIGHAPSPLAHDKAAWNEPGQCRWATAHVARFGLAPGWQA